MLIEVKNIFFLKIVNVWMEVLVRKKKRTKLTEDCARKQIDDR